MWGTVQHNGNVTKPFKIFNGVKQGCVLAPTLFGIFFSLLLKQAFGTVEEVIYLHTRTDGKLFNPSRLKAKTKVKKTIIRDDAVCRRCRNSSTQPITTSIFDGLLC